MPEDFELTDVFNLDRLFSPAPSEARRYALKIGSEQTKLLRQIAEQPRSSTTSPMTYELAQSVQGLSDGFSGMERGLDRAVGLIADLRIDLRNGFAGLGALFDWRMSSIITLLEQQQTTDYEIRDLLKYPRRAQANEDKEDARRAMQVALNSDGAAKSEWLDRALGFFASATDKNPFDYTNHLDMGKLLLQGLEKPQDALRHFEEAVRTAQTSGDQEFESKAHFFAGRAHGAMGNHEEAYRETRRALDLQPDAQVVAYECARYCALTERTDECASHIESLLSVEDVGGKVSAVQADAWMARVSGDSDFSSVVPRIREIDNRFNAEHRNKVADGFARLDSANRDVEEAQSLVEKLTGRSVDEGRELRVHQRALMDEQAAEDHSGMCDVLVRSAMLLEQSRESKKRVLQAGIEEVDRKKESIETERSALLNQAYTLERQAKDICDAECPVQLFCPSGTVVFWATAIIAVFAMVGNG